jgi:signal transduction histidine kinase
VGGRATALIVGDDRTRAERLCSQLEADGFSAALASSGAAGLEAARSTGPDVVFIDAAMPERGGFELCRLLKDDPELASALVILLTPPDDPEAVVRAIECGADTYITKPCDAPHLAACVRSLLESRRAARQLELVRKMDALSRLAGNVAHDYNNMLMVIQGFADILARELAGDDKRMRYIGQIRTAVGRSADLTQKLLTVGRRDVPPLEVIDVNAVIREASGTLAQTVGETVALTVRCADRPLPIEADRGQLTQVLVNLAVNAGEAMPGGGRLDIVTSAEPATSGSPRGWAVVSVSDTGCGMTKDAQDRLFEPFFTTKDRGKGTGFGLSVAYGIVSGISGSISCEGEPDRGAMFTIRVPLAGQGPL